MYPEGTAELPRNRCALCRIATIYTRTCTQKALQNYHALDVHSAELPRSICVLRRHCTTATLYMYSEGNAKLPCTRRVFTRHCRNARNKCALCRTATLSTRTCTQKALQNCHVLKKCPWKILQNYHVLEMHSEGNAELPR